MAIGTWGRSRKRIVTHAQHPTLKHSTMCGADSLQRLDARHLGNIDCKRCCAKLRAEAARAPYAGGNAPDGQTQAVLVCAPEKRGQGEVKRAANAEKAADGEIDVATTKPTTEQALLIAAAPDLYAALRAIADLARSTVRPSGQPALCRALLDIEGIARAALSKAEGR